MPDTTVDFSYDIQMALHVAFVILTALGGWLALKLNAYIAKKTGLTDLNIDSEVRTIINHGLEMAVHFALAKSEDANWGKVDVRNKIVADALNYAKSTIPDALSHFGIDNDMKLTAMILARLNKLNSAVTPIAVVAAPT